MILASLFHRTTPPTAKPEAATTAVSSEAVHLETAPTDEMLALIERIGREFVRRVAAPSAGWIAPQSAADFFSAFAQNLARVPGHEPYPEVLTSLADEVGRSTLADLARLVEIALQGGGPFVSRCDFYAGLRPPSAVVLTGKLKSTARFLWRANCPIIHAENEGKSMIIGCINPLAANEVRKHVSKQPYAPLMAALRLERDEWTEAMQRMNSIISS